MYCSSCGVAVTNDLTYCNHCGARLNRGETKSADVKPETLISMMVATFVMGTLAITALMGVMKAVLHFEFGPIMGLTSLCFLVMFILEGVFISLLFRRRRDAAAEEPAHLLQHRATTKELDTESRLPLAPVDSVTEHTTRAFAPVYGERK